MDMAPACNAEKFGDNIHVSYEIRNFHLIETTRRACNQLIVVKEPQPSRPLPKIACNQRQIMVVLNAKIIATVIKPHGMRVKVLGIIEINA
ncbi:MAG: hypothetical protein ABS91_00030 [Thiobacillus sp. SCN 64-35]|nr:MAG: hypothetical protein ABS91_00030 [Thiobacillus sp. SCN 64-35]OJY60340.1 MAG: hypothetical protein BGP19_15955 [Thiobacillus sp. 0-1251]